MKIILLTSNTCHCVDVEKELTTLGFSYEICDVEDCPDLVQRFGIRHCPTLILDDQRAIFVDAGNVTQLRQLLAAD